MKKSLPRTLLVLAAALAACGEGGADARGAEGEAPVYTSEVESVSRWIREGGGSGDAAGLAAAPNPRGEGVIVYSRAADSTGGERAAWVVVDSQVVPLNRASRRATPSLPARDDSGTWERIGIERREGEADLRGVVPEEDPPARRGAASGEGRPAPRPAPAREPIVAGPDSSPPVPFPAKQGSGPRDTLRIGDDPPPAPARRDTSPVGGSRDTVRVPSPSRPPRDTLRIPSGEAPATPVG